MDETGAFRTKTMNTHITSYEKKLSNSEHTFIVSTFVDMLSSLRSRPSTRILGRIESVSKLREVVTRESDRIRIDYGVVTEQNDPVLIYFNWFFDYLRYLKGLKDTFEKKIHLPLQQYFYGSFKSPFHHHPPISRESSASALDIYEVLGIPASQASSRLSGLSSEMSHVSKNSEEAPFSNERNSRDMLRMLSRQFKGIDDLYDNTDVEKVAVELFNLKDSWSLLLEDESEITPELFSPESESSVAALSKKGRGVATMIRLVPDIIVKGRLAANLARKWVNIDSQKTKNLSQKLSQIKDIHRQVSEKLVYLDSNIKQHKIELQDQTEELQRLLKLEDRSTDLNTQLYQSDQDIAALKTALETAKSDRDVITKELFDAVKSGAKSFDFLKLQYEQNRLTRHMLNRKIASTKYRRAVLSGDMQVEMDLKPTIIRFTNHVQERCEMLEDQLEKEREERKTLEASLAPLKEDRHNIEREMLQQSMAQSPPPRHRNFGVQTSPIPEMSSHSGTLRDKYIEDKRKTLKDKPKVMKYQERAMGSQFDFENEAFDTWPLIKKDDDKEKVSPQQFLIRAGSVKSQSVRPSQFSRSMDREYKSPEY